MQRSVKFFIAKVKSLFQVLKNPKFDQHILCANRIQRNKNVSVQFNDQFWRLISNLALPELTENYFIEFF